LKYGYVEIIGGIRLKIIGWDRRYDEYENREARLVYREGKMILWISKRIPRPKQYKPRDAIAVDINERKIVYGDDKINKDIGTAVDRAYRWKILAENLQRKYSSPRYPAWRRRKAIHNRIRSYHRKARNILEDWARKAPLKMVRLALKLQHAVAREDLTGLINSLRKIKNKDHRTKLIIMGYSRLVKWIDWQAMKHGVPLAIVNPNGTSSECPKCYSKLEENGYRRLKCPRCGFEADRDIIGKLNIRKRALKILGIKVIPGGVLAPLTAPQMTDVNPNRWGGTYEPLARGREPPPFQGGEEVSISIPEKLWDQDLQMKLVNALAPSLKIEASKGITVRQIFQIDPWTISILVIFAKARIEDIEMYHAMKRDAGEARKAERILFRSYLLEHWSKDIEELRIFLETRKEVEEVKEPKR
jgi:IS605 OrfB family transposase